MTLELELTIKASFNLSELVSVAQAYRVMNITPPIKFISTNDIVECIISYRGKYVWTYNSLTKKDK